MVGNALFLFLVVNAIRSSRQVRWPIILWLATTLLIGLFTAYQWHFGSATIQDDRFENSGFRTTDDRFSTVIMDYAEFDEIGAVKRVLGATSHPAVYAMNIILTIPFYVFLMDTTRSWWMRIFCILGLIVGSYNVLLTNTRAAVLVLGLSFVLVFFSALAKHRLAIFITAMVLCAAAVPFLPSAIYERALSAKNYSVGRSAAIQIRFQYWRAGVDMFADNWLLGVGSGNQKELPRRLANIRMPPNTSVHNEYFESLLETGILGYPFIVGFVVVLFRRCLRLTRQGRLAGDRELYLFGVATIIAFVTVLVFGLQSDVMHFTLKGWWLLMGLVVGIECMPTMPESGSSQPEKAGDAASAESINPL
jgi:O-antigen ligase